MKNQTLHLSQLHQNNVIIVSQIRVPRAQQSPFSRNALLMVTCVLKIVKLVRKIVA